MSKTLVVDDEETGRETASQWLQGDGFADISAANGPPRTGKRQSTD